MKHAWLVPTLLGLSVAVGGIAWDATHPSVVVMPPPETVGYRFVFDEPPQFPSRCGPCHATLLAVTYLNTTLDALPYRKPLTEVAWTPVAPGLQVIDAVGCTCEPNLGQGPSQNSTPFDPSIHGVRFTFYAFKLNGRLVATNANETDLAKFVLDGDFVRIPQATYSLAGGAPGTGLPGPFRELAPALAANLTGMVVGGINSQRLDAHPGRDLVGPLWLTVRLDAFVTTQAS